MKPILPAPGVHLNVAESDYRAWPAPSQSILKAGETALDMHHAMTQESEPTRAQIVGTALHWAFFEPARFTERCVTEPPVNKRTKDGKAELDAFYAANAGRLILDEDEAAQVRTWAEALREHPAAKYLLDLPGESEASLLWTDKETGESVKARIDRLPTEGPIIDLKTCASVDTQTLSRAIEKFGYHFQAAAYTAGVEAVGRGLRDYVLVCIQKEPPFHVRVIRLERDWILAGEAKYRRALRLYSASRKANYWPGYADTIEPLYAPSWIIRQLDTIDMEFTQ